MSNHLNNNNTNNNNRNDRRGYRIPECGVSDTNRSTMIRPSQYDSSQRLSFDNFHVNNSVNNIDNDRSRRRHSSNNNNNSNSFQNKRGYDVVTHDRPASGCGEEKAVDEGDTKRYRREDYYYSEERSRGGGGGGAGRRTDRYDDNNNNNSSNYYRDRSSSRDYYSNDNNRGGKAYNIKEDWKCLECYTWNDPIDRNCRRCRAPVRYARDERDNNLSFHPKQEPLDNVGFEKKEAEQDTLKDRWEGSNSSKGMYSDFDEFGRKADGTTKPPKIGKKAREWPPCFETDGTTYMFDTRSGMFYEPESDFFYDPKSKLYYGNKKRTYYRYNPDNKKHYEQVEKAPDSSSDPTSSAHVDLGPDPILDSLKSSSLVDPMNKIKGPTISITLKTKALKKLSSTSGEAAIKLKKQMDDKVNTEEAAEKSNRLPKQHASNLEKWAERQEEMRKDQQTKTDPSASLSTPPNNTRKVFVSTKDKGSSETDVAKTDKGEPICLLCRRKFPTLAKLQYHERVSDLHKENLAKQQQAAESKGPATAAADAPKEQKPTYIDRAQQRRLMHGPETTSIMSCNNDLLLSSVASVTVSTEPIAPITTEFKSPENNLGESNIGNQMLQKLGWKKGTSLGNICKSNNEEVVSIGGQDKDETANRGTSITTSSNNSTTEMLRNDWARIESIAAANNRGGTSRSNNINNNGGQGGIGSN